MSNHDNKPSRFEGRLKKGLNNASTFLFIAGAVIAIRPMLIKKLVPDLVRDVFEPVGYGIMGIAARILAKSLKDEDKPEDEEEQQA